MAETKYTFNILEDFLNQTADSDKLTNEIINSSINIDLLFINSQEDICDIWFDSELNGSDYDTLKYIVNHHDGEPYDTFECKGIDSENESSTSSLIYVNRNSLEINNINPGTYKIQWYFEFFLDYYRIGGKIRLQINDEKNLTEVIVSSVLREGQWDSRYGFSFVEFSNSDNFIDLDYAAFNSRYSIAIKNVKIYVHKIDTLIETVHEGLNPYIIKIIKI